MSPTRVMSHLSRTPSLKEAEDGRLLARIERNFECLRRDGRAAGTLSGWGELLRTKFKHHKAETSDLAAAQSSTCAAWLCGSLTGRVAMVEFLQAEKLVRQVGLLTLSTPCLLSRAMFLLALRFALSDHTS